MEDTMSNEYRLNTIADFLAVPKEKLEACLQDFLVWLRFAKDGEQISSDVSTLLKVEKGDISLKLTSFIWVDDGLTGVTGIDLRESGSNKEIGRIKFAVSPPDAANTEALKTWPERIYLQHSHDGYPVPTHKVDTDEITWCQDRQFDCDVEYVRADLVATPSPELLLTDEQIREIFLANGFTIKDGHADLKPYVYQAAHALLAAISQPPAPQLVICEDCGDACTAHNPGVCGNCYAMKYRDAQPPAVQEPVAFVSREGDRLVGILRRELPVGTDLYLHAPSPAEQKTEGSGK